MLLPRESDHDKETVPFSSVEEPSRTSSYEMIRTQDRKEDNLREGRPDRDAAAKKAPIEKHNPVGDKRARGWERHRTLGGVSECYQHTHEGGSDRRVGWL